MVTEIHFNNRDSSRDNPKNTKIMPNENPNPYVLYQMKTRKSCQMKRIKNKEKWNNFKQKNGRKCMNNIEESLRIIIIMIKCMNLTTF